MGILYRIIMYAQSSRTALSLTLNVGCNVEIVVCYLNQSSGVVTIMQVFYYWVWDRRFAMHADYRVYATFTIVPKTGRCDAYAPLLNPCNDMTKTKPSHPFLISLQPICGLLPSSKKAKLSPVGRAHHSRAGLC